MRRVPTSPSHPELAALRAWTEGCLGPIARLEDRSRPFGRNSALWHVTDADGRAWFVKRHEKRSLFERALAAYRNVLPGVKLPRHTFVPRLLHASESLGAVILSAHEGTTLDLRTNTDAEGERCHQLAGRFLAALQGLPITSVSPTRLVTIRRKRVEQYVELAEPTLDQERFDWLQRVLQDPLLYQASPAVACHMDFTPRNWLIGGGGNDLQLTVIDWERARPGTRFQDLVHLGDRFWDAAPRCREAFFSGFGQEPDEREMRRMDLLFLLDVSAGIPWARSHGDAAFEALNREMFDRLRARLDG